MRNFTKFLSLALCFLALSASAHHRGGAASATPQAATPTFSPAGGSYSSTQSVTLSCSTPSPSIYDTVDGSTPTYPITGTTALYTSAISVSSSQTIKALCVASGYSNSSVGSAAYVISGGSGPSSPTNLVMSLQALQTSNSGGVVVDPQGYTSPFNAPPYINDTQISWTQGTGGVGGVSYNKVYRSTTSNSTGFSLIYTSGSPITSYMDTAANNVIYYGNSDSNYTGTNYWYKVTAVDTVGNESAQSAADYFVQYQNGVNNWGIGFDSGVTNNYQSTTEVYSGHTYSRQVVVTSNQTSNFAYILPFADCTVATWNMWGGTFNYYQFDIWVPNANADALIYFLRVGDQFIYNSSAQIVQVHLNAYVTTVANTWNHVKIPLTDVLTDYGSSGAGPPVVRYAMYKHGFAPQNVATGYTWYIDNEEFTQ